MMIKLSSISWAITVVMCSHIIDARVLLTTGNPVTSTYSEQYTNEFFDQQRRLNELKRTAGFIHRAHSYEVCNHHPSYGYTMRYSPERCASWTIQDYCKAVMELYCVYIPIASTDHIPDGYILCGITPDRSSYVCLNDNYRLQVMRQTQLYPYDSFWNYVQQFDDYQLLFPEIYQWVHSTPDVYNKLSFGGRRALEEKHALWIQAERMRFEEMIKTFEQQTAYLTDQASEWKELNEYLSNTGLRCQHLQRRISAYEKTERSSINSSQNYTINSDVAVYLQNNGYKSRLYTTNYGNQLQHALHHECIDIVTQTVNLRAYSMIYRCKTALIDIADASREFNQIGHSYKSSMLNDCAYALLDLGSAIAEGVAQGVIYAAKRHNGTSHPNSVMYSCG